MLPALIFAPAGNGINMKFFDIVTMLKTRLSRKKIRTCLAVLGIAVGVMSVTAITTVGDSGERAVFGEFSKMGIDGVNIKKRVSKINSKINLTYNDVKKAKENVSDAYISGIYTNVGVVSQNEFERDCMVMAVDSDFYKIASLKLSEGRFISNSDNENQNLICVIDDATKKRLYGNQNVLGKTIDLMTSGGVESFIICGVIENSGGAISDSIPLFFYIPVNSVDKIFNTKSIDYISVVSHEKEKFLEKSTEVLDLLDNKDIFFIEDINAEKAKIENATDMLKNIIGSIALISLIVGGIGVMNIMLVSVSERTKEIGIKKSIGASNNDILFEFLTESLFITLFAGIIGMLAGILVSYFFSKALDINFILSKTALLKIFSITFFTGLIFGGYPALIAANKDPVRALYSE